MNCTKCGAEMPEGVTTCPNCPEEIPEVKEEQVAPVEEAATEPKAEPAKVEVTVKAEAAEKPLKKGKFLKEKATKGIKTCSAIGWIVALVSIALILFLGYTALTSSLLESPAIEIGKMILGPDDRIINEMETLLSDDSLYQYALEEYNESVAEGELTEEEIALGQEGLDKAVIFMDHPSLLNLRSFYVVILECLEHENPVSQAYAEKFGYIETMGRPLELALNSIILVVAGIAVLCSLFMLIAAAKKSVGLTIFSLILTVIADVLFVKIYFTAALAVVLIIICIFNGVILSSYKEYKKTFVK